MQVDEPWNYPTHTWRTAYTWIQKPTMQYCAVNGVEGALPLRWRHIDVRVGLNRHGYAQSMLFRPLQPWMQDVSLTRYSNSANFILQHPGSAPIPIKARERNLNPRCLEFCKLLVSPLVKDVFNMPPPQHRISKPLPEPIPDRYMFCGAGKGNGRGSFVSHYTREERWPLHLPWSRRITGTAHWKHARAPEDSKLLVIIITRSPAAQTCRRWNAPGIYQNRADRTQEIPSNPFLIYHV